MHLTKRSRISISPSPKNTKSSQKIQRSDSTKYHSNSLLIRATNSKRPEIGQGKWPLTKNRLSKQLLIATPSEIITKTWVSISRQLPLIWSLPNCDYLARVLWKKWMRNGLSHATPTANWCRPAKAPEVTEEEPTTPMIYLLDLIY